MTDVDGNPLDDGAARSISEYALLEFLGEGSTAHVYLAERRLSVPSREQLDGASGRNDDPDAEEAHSPPGPRRVAIKVIDKLLVRHAGLENKIRQEMVLHAQLRHPSVLRVLEAFEDARNYYMVLEFCERRDENMTICGTPNFIAPEILANDSAYSEAVDVWSLGCILYCLLIGRAPFEGRKVSETLANVANAGKQELVFPDGFSASAGDLIKRLLTPPSASRASRQHRFASSVGDMHYSSSSCCSGSSEAFSDHDIDNGDANDGDDGDDEVDTSPSITVDLGSEFVDEQRESSQSIARGQHDTTQRAGDERTSRTAELQASPSSSYLSVILHLEVQDIPALGVGSATRASVVWKCVESSEVGLLPTFVLQMSTGLEAEYSSSRGVVAGTSSDGSPFRYEFGSLQDKARRSGAEWLQRDRVGGSAATETRRVEPALCVLVRFCQCLVMRSMQLRRQALRLDSSKLPMVHYDALPETLQASFRRASPESTVRQTCTPLAQHQSQSPAVDDDARSAAQQSAVIAGVGEGLLDTLSGDLRLVFLDGSELSLCSDGTRLRFRRSKASCGDEFQLLTSTGASAGFLPTAVRKRLESVPAFIRKLRSASSSQR
ncbi:hypothetical protein PybrP1_010454 [[Pythium] brassicae (nom. inval.)]|nr:hypothetical protein PybrP1_010454 [[Pythium] brassicae (nom. inval.)]